MQVQARAAALASASPTAMLSACSCKALLICAWIIKIMIHMDLQDANVLAALIELLADNGPEEEAVVVIRKVSLATQQ